MILTPKNRFHKILIYGIDCFIPFILNPHSGYNGKIVNLKTIVVAVQYYLATFLDFCDTCASKSLKKECRIVHITRNKFILKTYDFLYLKINTENNKIMYRPFHTT